MAAEMILICQTIMANKRRCSEPIVRGSLFCAYHQDLRKRTHKAKYGQKKAAKKR